MTSYLKYTGLVWVLLELDKVGAVEVDGIEAVPPKVFVSAGRRGLVSIGECT